MTVVRFLIIGDMHGNKPRILCRKFDAIIATGDFCYDGRIRPLINAWHMLHKRKTINQVSFSDFISSTIGKKKFQHISHDSLLRGRKVLSYLNSFGKPVFIVPGNWDQSNGKTRIKNEDANKYNHLKSFLDDLLGNETNLMLKNNLRNIYDCQFKLHNFHGISIIGYGLSSSYEDPSIRNGKFKADELKKLNDAYAKIINRLSGLHKAAQKNPVVFITHNVPYNTKLDIVVNKKKKIHMGSSVARDFCKRYRPLVCIGGHIHEGFGECMLGNTLVINAGNSQDTNIILDIADNEIKNVEFCCKMPSQKL